MTREVVVALTTNIASQEFRRRDGDERGLPPEHPRAGSTDDVEGIFACLHQLLGPIFDEKTFNDAFPIVLMEYTKTSDPNFLSITTLGEMRDIRMDCCSHSMSHQEGWRDWTEFKFQDVLIQVCLWQIEQLCHNVDS